MPSHDRLPITLAHSPDPDDAFMWWPLVGLDEQYQNPAYSAGIGMLIWGLRNMPRGSHLGVSTVNGTEVISSGGRWYDAFSRWRNRGPSGSSKSTREGVSV